jgi:hypothetical protein
MKNSVIINEIQLSNWFNFKGDFKDNSIAFSEGLNIFTGDNNAGKTKLHNAFRWIIEENVLINRVTEATKEKISDDNIKKIVNHLTFRKTKIGALIQVGVKIKFTISIKGGKKTYILENILKCRKEDDNTIKIIKELSFKNAFQCKSVGGPRTAIETYDELKKKIIPRHFINFFLIEGEQLGNLTPLEGNELKNTINAIVSLNELDDLVAKSNNLFSNADSTFDKVSAREDKGNSDVSKAHSEKISLKEQLVIFKEKDKNLKIEEDKNITIRNEWKKKAEANGKVKELIRNQERLKGAISNLENKEYSAKLGFISSIINSREFSITKLWDDTDRIHKLKETKSNINSYILKRKLELDADVDKEEQNMIMSLEKSQPKPEILEEMLERSHCFVCNSSMNDQSKEFISKKLIPFFKNESKSDPLIDKLNEVHNLFRGFELGINKFKNPDPVFFENHIKNITDILLDKDEANENMKDFNEENGAIIIKDKDADVSVSTFLRAEEELNRLKDVLQENENDIKNIKSLIVSKDEIISKDSSQNTSKTLQSATKLKSFSNDLMLFLTNLKKNKYLEFAADLEKKATKRYKELLKHNKAKNHKVSVKAIENSLGEFDFSIKIIDQFGQTQDQAGGADQALRRVSVIFALLDMAENKNGYPFIADAPISRLSSDNKKEFFMTLLKDSKNPDSSVKQSIIMTMDLVSAEDSINKLQLNDLGEKVLSEIKNEKTSSMITVHNNIINTIN